MWSGQNDCLTGFGSPSEDKLISDMYHHLESTDSLMVIIYNSSGGNPFDSRSALTSDEAKALVKKYVFDVLESRLTKSIASFITIDFLVPRKGFEFSSHCRKRVPSEVCWVKPSLALGSNITGDCPSGHSIYCCPEFKTLPVSFVKVSCSGKSCNAAWRFGSSWGGRPATVDSSAASLSEKEIVLHYVSVVWLSMIFIYLTQLLSNAYFSWVDPCDNLSGRRCNWHRGTGDHIWSANLLCQCI